VAIRVNNLGGVLKDLGDLAGAKAAFERALLIREVAFGKEHPDVAQSLWWLGVLAQQQDDKEAARDYYERALQIFEKFLPPDHSRIKNLKGHLNSL
jgi:tetratricopeptide (TPR) repeat protein